MVWYVFVFVMTEQDYMEGLAPFMANHGNVFRKSMVELVVSLL